MGHTDANDRPPMSDTPPPASIDLSGPELYLNRELAALEFNFRVLSQARDPRVPLLERMRFLCISSNNLDKFFELRVAVLRQHLLYGDARPGADGLAPTEVLARIRERSLELITAQYHTWKQELAPALAHEGVRFLTRKHWTDLQKRWLLGYFRNEILPVLSPLGLDPAHPFPRILNKSLNIVVLLDGHDAFGREGHLALVRAPRSLPRLIRLPDEVAEGPNDFVFLAGLLQQFSDDMFPGFTVKDSYQFRVTRNSELTIEEEDIENLANALTEELFGRGYARPVRLEIAENCPKPIVDFLISNFGLSEQDVYRNAGPVNLHRVLTIYEQIDRPDLKYAPFTPRISPSLVQHPNIFEAISQHDILLHQPYESFQAVMELLRQAAQDPQVLAIKQTLYRVGSDSPVVDQLIEAAHAGKDVSVVIELRARFEEAANIRLANRLQAAGVQVIYGVVGYKTHAKMLLVIRREHQTLHRYVHLSTGNYHQITSRLYTDIGLLTAHPEIGEDANKIFQQLSGLGSVVRLKHLLYSPFTLYKGLMQRIDREIDLAKNGHQGRVIAKINALNEQGMVEALYRASQAGVQIDLIVRGACTLRPGLPGISDTIRVRSIVGRFLEHSRVYWFGNGGESELICASADWMERNLLHRIEIGFPILDPEIAQRVYAESLANYLVDNTDAWILDSDSHYHRVAHANEPAYSAQRSLLAKLTA